MFPPKLSKTDWSRKKQDKKSYCKKLLNNLERKKEITLSRNFETNMKVPSLKVGAQRLRFIWKHGVQKGSKGTHLENPINFRALLTGKSAFKVLFHHTITPRIDILHFISDKQSRKSENQTLGWSQLRWHNFLLRLIWVRGQWKWEGQGTYILNSK